MLLPVDGGEGEFRRSWGQLYTRDPKTELLLHLAGQNVSPSVHPIVQSIKSKPYPELQK